MTQTQGKVVKAAGVMIAATLASRVLGQLRETAIAAWFGQNAVTDVYKAAFRLPDLMSLLVAGGVFSAAFVPVFTQYIKDDNEEDAWTVFSTVATLIALVVSAFVILGEIFARPLVPLIAKGFAGDPLKLDATAHLTRILLPAQLFFMLGALLMATLYVRGKFLAPALGPIIYNLAIIVVGWLLHERIGIEGLCWGVLLGAFAGNFVLQAFAARRVGVRYRPMLRLRHPGVIKAGKLALPVVCGLALPQLYPFINTWFASTLAVGTISALDNANKLMQIPLGIFGQAISIAVFPTMTLLVARGDMDGFRSAFMRGTRALWFLTLPVSLLMIAAAPEIVSILFQYHKFTAEDTRITAIALAIYSTGLFAFACQSILNRAFYALHDTLSPVLIGTATTVLFVILNMVMIKPWGYQGLAAAGSVAATLHLCWMVGALRRRVGMPLGALALGLAKMTAASLAGMAAGWGIKLALAAPIHSAPLHPKLQALCIIALVMGGGGAVFLALARLLRCEEMDDAFRMLRRRRGGARAAEASPVPAPTGE